MKWLPSEKNAKNRFGTSGSTPPKADIPPRFIVAPWDSLDSWTLAPLAVAALPFQCVPTGWTVGDSWPLWRVKVGLPGKLRAVPDIVDDDLMVALVDLVEKAVRIDDELTQGQRRILGDTMTAAWEGLDASQRLVYPCGEVLRGQAIVLVDVRERFGVGRCRIIGKPNLHADGKPSF